MGVARLKKVTVISPRSEYSDVVKSLAKFRDFHPLESASPDFDPRVQELTVRAVRLFSQADQAVKDLGLKDEPGWMDLVFRGVKIEKTKFDAAEWDELLGRVEKELEPLVQDVKGERGLLQRAMKEEGDAQALRGALESVSGFSADIEGVANLKRFRTVIAVVNHQVALELRNSLPEAVFISQPLSQGQEVVLVVVKMDEGVKLDRTIKSLEVKPLVIPPAFPQNPAEAYKRLTEDQETARKGRADAEAALARIGRESAGRLLAIKELTETARNMLDDARVSGRMKRMATISGYIPAKREGDFKNMFGRWMVYADEVGTDEEAPVLFRNPGPVSTWQLVTAEQGIPGNHEVDPTPLISFVFPIFFGLMFGDFGHGLVFSLFVLFVRQRVTGTKRQWADIFLVTGVSSMVFGALFGEFFGLSLYNFIPIPPVIEIINRTGPQPTPDIGNIETVMILSIMIGVAHIVTGLGLDVYEGWKSGEKLELLIEKVPALSMYLSGLGYGIAFIGAGFKFNVLASSVTAPLVGMPVNLLGGVSLAVLVPSMLILFLGHAVALKLGKVKGESLGGAISQGGLEVFEKILQFLSNTISYVRLAVMLLVHAVLLMIVNLLFPISNPLFIVPWVIFNLLVLALEALIVYVQDLRLHVYEFFTKFYAGNGRPFRRILPERTRISIEWR